MKARPGIMRSIASRYEPLDGFVLRAPLLPLDRYRALTVAPGSADCGPDIDEVRRLASDSHVRRALAVGSLSLLDALARERQRASRAARSRSRLLRYLIRMATRPTPFGLFAGVAIGRWGDRTDLRIGSGRFRQRTRPDMAWLMPLVAKIEAMPDVARHLRLVANPSIVIHAGRAFLAERVSSGESSPPAPVSIRATGIVRRALAETRDPIPYAELAAVLLASTAGATPEQVETLLSQLREHTFLLTDLRPPLTVGSPARYVVDRLAGVSAADGIRTRLETTLATAAVWDASSNGDGVEGYRAMVETAGTVGRFDRSPFQVDAALQLGAHTIHRRVGEEVARLAEILIRISPLPRGALHLSAFRRLFEQRYGAHREVPVVELLDPNFGLGPPSQVATAPASTRRASKESAARRHRVLTDLALAALRNRTLAVELDEPLLKQLESGEAPLSVPSSLDLFVAIAAASPQALDAGEFQVVLGPGVGASAAGRTLGRFADLVPGARAMLERIARAEERCRPQAIWAELTYQPRSFRLANVAIRPNVRAYEIVVGTASGDGSARTIPLQELVVGVRHGAFYVRWPKAGRDVIVTSGHMLNYGRAPDVCRFLAEVSRDGCCQLSAFTWGPAAGFPFLPRVHVGRSVVSLAQWRLTASAAASLSATRPDTFAARLTRWRAQWDAPRHVYLTSGDNRLLLDLLAPAQVEELRAAILRLRGPAAVTLSEVLPDLDQAWVCDSDHRAFVTELVVPLVRRSGGGDHLAHMNEANRAVSRADAEVRAVGSEVAAPSARLRPPGSDWLFVKLYGPRELENDLIAGAMRSFAGEATASGMADAWFFLRYSDPDRHLRLRFRGEPSRLVRELLPAICTWAGALIDDGVCRRFAFDTYEREPERFGGSRALPLAEHLFGADSRAVADLLHGLQARAITGDLLMLAVSTVDTILDGMGLEPAARAAWARDQAGNRHETGAEYRRRKDDLRALLGRGVAERRAVGGDRLATVLGDLLNAVRKVTERYAALAVAGEPPLAATALCQSIVHLHLNRLLGADSATERRVLGLLGRTRDALRHAPLRTTGPTY
jgi:thiopeptide-type bacteriocin biosynthesis protein